MDEKMALKPYKNRIINLQILFDSNGSSNLFPWNTKVFSLTIILFLVLSISSKTYKSAKVSLYF